MGFSSIRLYNFRNLEDRVLPVSAPEVFLVGENGQGKTNLLEAVYCLSFGSSFRTKKDESLIRHDGEETAVEGFSDSSSSVTVRISKGQKELKLDGKTVRDRAEMVGRYPCIVFSHEDIGYITGNPERQRTFFNQTIVLQDPLFLDTIRRYSKVLKQRNAAVKARSSELIEIYDEELAASGLVFTERRRRLVADFNEDFGRLFREISGLDVPISIRYVPSWKADCQEKALEELRAQKDRDFFFSTTTSGPHRDRFRFMFGTKDFAHSASTGQIRLASLILKTAQAVGFSAFSGRLPILLLDDVLLEMDPERRRRFIEHLPEYDQTYFTFLPDEPFSSYRKRDTLVYKVKEGRFFEHG